ncbi:hypothetical protein KSP39_PZI021865 [Platanthera zijinensis]|uniref:Uncharacterized protein n=1 Tax=Platanthera zijinensis TaxID=2320716 RepID=A0AAP0FVM9_9ASPA
MEIPHLHTVIYTSKGDRSLWAVSVFLIASHPAVSCFGRLEIFLTAPLLRALPLLSLADSPFSICRVLDELAASLLCSPDLLVVVALLLSRRACSKSPLLLPLELFGCPPSFAACRGLTAAPCSPTFSSCVTACLSLVRCCLSCRLPRSNR